jgi:hypothetical protein
MINKTPSLTDAIYSTDEVLATQGTIHNNL